MADKKTLMNAIRGTELDPTARLDMVRQSGSVLYEYIGGSRAYGTFLPESDADLRGVFCLPLETYLSPFVSPVQEVSDQRELVEKKKNDNIFYALHRFFQLLRWSNPNIIEALWIPKDCVVSTSPEMEIIINNRNLFISKECLPSHFGYARQQISKARGKNKKVNNPCPKERPKKLDFCRLVPCIPGSKLWTHPDVPSSRFPFRPIPLSEMPWIDLKDYHVAAVEHAKDAYRLYYYGEESKGVFRGDDMLVCESIPMDDEWPRFTGILLYDETEYDRAVNNWKSYWDWVNNRNDSRWINQEKGLVDYDSKNMMHCIRLLMSGLNIIKNGEPIVRFTGQVRQRLLDIRNGKLEYEDLIKESEDRMTEMDEVTRSSTIPEKVDSEKIEALYKEVSEMAWKRFSN